MKLKWVLAGLLALAVILLLSNPSQERCKDEFKKQVQGFLLRDTYKALTGDDGQESKI